MCRTPTEELRIASAYLNTAEESFNQATAHLASIQGKQPTCASLLAKFQVTFNHLQTQISQLEKLIPAVDQSDQQD